MEFQKKSNFSPKKISSLNSLNEKYPSDLTLYNEIPSEQIDIEEFQEMAVERVKLLRLLETASLKSVKGMSLKDEVMNEMTKQNMKYFLPIVRGSSDPETRRRDYLSHFILRLCYCLSDELRKWFLARELELFKLKFFNFNNKEHLQRFMEMNNLNYSPVTDEEKNKLAVDLVNSTSKQINLDVTVIYKVPFTQVLDLVRSRKVFISSGNAYVPQSDLISILSSIFRVHLSYSLAVCAANIPKLQNDERLCRILKGLHTSYTGNDYCAKPKDSVSISALDELSIQSFPLCMRSVYETFKATHHLRYFARCQLGLFLKGIGLSLEDSLKFWREGFTKNPDIDVDVFEKRYSYNIRHSYGTEGKRANYAPQNCMKIITSSVTSGDNHGCPFKHYDANSLKQKLLSYNISLVDISVITDYVTKGHFQLACTKYFEVTHSVTNATGINHPNTYFEESQKIIQGKDNKKLFEKTSKSESLKTNDEGIDETFDLDFSNIDNLIDVK